MNKSWFYLGAIGSLAILMTSCGGDSGKPAAPAAPANTPAATPAPAPAAPAAAVPATPAAPTATTTAKPATTAAKPTDPAKATPGIKPVSVDVAAGLIPPTNADNWAKTVSKGRSDPFAALALQPTEIGAKDPFDSMGKPSRASSKISSKIASNSSTAIKSGVNSPLPSIKTGTKIATNGIGNTSTNSSNPKRAIEYQDKPMGYVPISAVPRSGNNKALPAVVVELNPVKSTRIATIPSLKVTPLPSNTSVATKPEQVAEKTLQSMSLEISGVIEVAGKTQVIVKLPNESFSRYIEVGDRVASSNILVKRVEGQNTLAPTVVLEEAGVEVQRKIGEKSTPVAR
jgi:hypothetical protein